MLRFFTEIIKAEMSVVTCNLTISVATFAVAVAVLAPFVLAVAVAGLALNVPFSTANNIWIGLQKGYVAGGWDIVQTLLSAGGLLWAALAGAGVLTMVAAFYGGIVVASHQQVLAS